MDADFARWPRLRAGTPARIANGEMLEPGHGNPAEALRRLAVESLADGCLAEGFAAAIAGEALARAQDSAVREALEIIARDEASHAELSWAILAWCLGAGRSRRSPR